MADNDGQNSGEGFMDKFNKIAKNVNDFLSKLPEGSFQIDPFGQFEPAQQPAQPPAPPAETPRGHWDI